MLNNIKTLAATLNYILSCIFFGCKENVFLSSSIFSFSFFCAVAAIFHLIKWMDGCECKYAPDTVYCKNKTKNRIKLRSSIDWMTDRVDKRRHFHCRSPAVFSFLSVFIWFFFYLSTDCIAWLDEIKICSNRSDFVVYENQDTNFISLDKFRSRHVYCNNSDSNKHFSKCAVWH